MFSHISRTTIAFTVAVSLLIFAGAASAHQATYSFPQVPDPGQMVIDGQDNDWGWYNDGLYSITKDNLFWNTAYRVSRPSDDEWNVLLRIAWSSPPDNALYCFARVTDDALGIGQVDPNNYFKDDSMEINVDADDSGGLYRQQESEMTTAQSYGVRILPPTGESGTWLWTWRLDAPDVTSARWSTKEPYMIFRWTLDPPDAKPHQQQPKGSRVTYTYEVKQWIWDFHDKDGPDGSTRHLFAPDQRIGLTFHFNEADLGDRFAQHGTSPHDGSFFNTDFGSDFVTVATPGATGSTAVEATTWGRIKASYQNAGK